MLNKKEPATFWEFFVEAASDKVIIILAVAAVVSIILGMTVPSPHTGEVEYSHGWIEGTAIIISILIVTMVGSVNNYQKAKQFEQMEAEQSVKTINVIRNGEKKSILSDTLVVGDLLFLEYGMELSADGLILQSSELKMSEAAITGESDLMEKDPEKDPFILSGTAVDEGTGIMMVIGVGMNSFQGHLKSSLDAESGDTPLQEHLAHLADMVGYFGFALAFLLIAGLFIKEGILISKKERVASGTAFLNYILIAVTLVVVAIPEGLPLAVTIALAFAMRSMMSDHCMVRVLASCETMGAATAVCSDKTGTLTTNVMTCVQGVIGSEEFLLKGFAVPRQPNVHIADPDNVTTRTNPAVMDLFCFSLAINSTADQEMKEGVLQWRGNKTEIGMLGLLQRFKYDMKAARARFPHHDLSKIKQFPFNSAKKRMTTIIREDNGTLTAHIKGASEAILEQCAYHMDASGNIAPIDDNTRAIYNDIIEDMALNRNRTMGLACLQDMPSANGQIPTEEPDVKFVFLGVLGIQDPVREEVPDAVEACHAAGLIIRMCTGDNITTAIAVAKKCHIYHEDGWDIAMQGTDFRKMYNEDKETLITLIPRLKVLARSSPQDKHILVGLIQASGEVVGVTGDGTNDAPALKLADVGFAMKSGTDIAKGAADMVLLDDNFATVVTAIMWGRAVNDNIKKFLQFQLTINCAGVMLTLIASLVSPTSKEPFTPVQMLWLNLIMDTLAALALSTELPEKASLLRAPVYKAAPLITRRMWCFIACHGAWQFALILTIMLVGHDWFETIEKPGLCKFDYGLVPTLVNGTTVMKPHHTRVYCDKLCTDDGGVLKGGYVCQQGPTHSTMLFNIFILSQVFNVVNSRKIYGEMNPLEGLWTRSKQLVIIFIIIGGLQVIAVELLGRFMSTTGLGGYHWGVCIGLAAITIVIGILQRFVPITDVVPESVVEHHKYIADLKAAVLATRKDEPAHAPAAQTREPAHH